MVAQYGVNVAVEAEIHDPAVERRPGTSAGGVPEDQAEGIDSRLPQVSQFRRGPTVKDICIRTGPGGSGVASAS